MFHSCCPCGGCGGEVYWSEWHNDPPYCQDPCNNYGEWIGPRGGGCNSGACGYEGGYGSAQPRPVATPNNAYAKHRPAYGSPVAANSRPQQPQMRTASRPTPNRVPQQQTRGSSGTPSGKIQW